MYDVGRMRTYYLGQTAVVAFDLVRDVLSLDERGPEEYEGIRRTGDMRGTLAFVLGVGTGRTKGRGTGRRHYEHGRRRGRTSRHGEDWFVIGHWTRFGSKCEAHARIWVVNQRRHVVWTPGPKHAGSAQQWKHAELTTCHRNPPAVGGRGLTWPKKQPFFVHEMENGKK